MSAVNINEAIEKTSRMLAEQPEKAKSKNVPATARLLDGLRCEVTGPNGETLRTDMPPAMGGAASAPNPGWVLRAAVASCTATVIAMRAARLGIDLATLEVTIESYSDNRGLLGLDDKIPAGLSSLLTRVKIGAADAPADCLRELAQWGDRHSPVACTTRIPPGFVLEVEVV
jgi:organic hydroperoxide reductase OsmC/OhrA